MQQHLLRQADGGGTLGWGVARIGVWCRGGSGGGGGGDGGGGDDGGGGSGRLL